jgi:transposase
MCYELSDYEWTAIKPMLPNKPRGVRRVMTIACSMASFGFCVQVRHDAICQRHMVPASVVTIASNSSRASARETHERSGRSAAW